MNNTRLWVSVAVVFAAAGCGDGASQQFGSDAGTGTGGAGGAVVTSTGGAGAEVMPGTGGALAASGGAAGGIAPVSSGGAAGGSAGTAPGTGGRPGTGGAAASTGGRPGTGGAGGASRARGGRGTGGAPAGTGGASSSGGAPGTGGAAPGTGGRPASSGGMIGSTGGAGGLDYQALCAALACPPATSYCGSVPGGVMCKPLPGSGGAGGTTVAGTGGAASGGAGGAPVDVIGGLCGQTTCFGGRMCVEETVAQGSPPLVKCVDPAAFPLSFCGSQTNFSGTDCPRPITEGGGSKQISTGDGGFLTCAIGYPDPISCIGATGSRYFVQNCAQCQ